MANVSNASLCLLPVEILHRIFDELDTLTIVLSLRCTCRKLKSVVETYDRYILDFRVVSKLEFQVLCRLVDPRKVISLILSPSEPTVDQNKLLISYFHRKKFSRIRSLTLHGIEEKHLKNLLKLFNIPSLVSFSFRIEKYDERCSSTDRLLSSIISQANLRYLEFELRAYRLEKFSWPSQCMIRYLKIVSCKGLNQFFTIFRGSPYLQTIIVYFDYFNSESVNLDSLPASLPQLTSLTLENLDTTIDNVEIFLSIMSSLTYLKLTGDGHYLDGNRWEQFIQTNLPLLNKFELFVQERKLVDLTDSDVQLTITLFQTPFWLQHKKWFFKCEYEFNNQRVLRLYSTPVCTSSLIYKSESKKVSLSSSDTINNISTMDNVNGLSLILTNISLDDIQQMNEGPSSDQSLFRRVTKLQLRCDIHLSSDLTLFISTFIDLTKLTEIKLAGYKISQSEPDLITNLSNLLKQAHNLVSLEICCSYSNRNTRITAQDICYSYYHRHTTLTAQDICSMVPSHTKHLSASIKNLDEAKICLEQLQHLLTACFYYIRNSLSSDSVSEWLEENKRGSSYFIGADYSRIWFVHHNTQLTEVKIGNKRMKLTTE